MKCLTVRQPWASAIFALGKDVENRSRRIRFRQRILIQAGKRIDRAACEKLGLDAATLPTGCVLGSVEIAGCRRDSTSRWADRGAWHWELANPQSLNEHPPQKGSLGFFEVHLPPALLQQMENPR